MKRAGRILIAAVFGLLTALAMMLVFAIGNVRNTGNTYIDLSSPSDYVLFFGMAATTGWLWYSWWYRRPRMTADKRTGPSRCPKCNYDLRGELDKGCSECGWGRQESDK